MVALNLSEILNERSLKNKTNLEPYILTAVSLRKDAHLFNVSLENSCFMKFTHLLSADFKMFALSDSFTEFNLLSKIKFALLSLKKLQVCNTIITKSYKNATFF